MRPKIFNFLFLTLLTVALSAQAFAADVGVEKTRKSAYKTASTSEATPNRTYLNINNISTVLKNDGISDIDVNEAQSGLVFPKGSHGTAVFQSGFLWGGKIPGEEQVRVGGTAYRTSLKPGNIPTVGGQGANPSDSRFRIYRVRPDVYPGGPFVDLSLDAIDELNSEENIRAQYELDWSEWPADLGAPYDDVNGNGQYDAGADVPGVAGADQTVWFVANDTDADQARFPYGADPFGIEMQATMWAYAQSGALGNMFFRKYKIINKGSNDVEDMYVCMWSDVDLGFAGDDLVGCDVDLSLGYSYNANAVDQSYAPLPPPAVGFDFFQGPLQKGVSGHDVNNNGVDDAQDYAVFDGELKGPGFVNLPMSSFFFFINLQGSIYSDPEQGVPIGSTQFYNLFQGKIGKTGEPFVNPITGEPQQFTVDGDPLTRTGWRDGVFINPGDRRQGQASGPFDFKVGDTQEVVVAEIAAGAIPGVDRLAALGLLRFYDQQAQLAYNSFFELATPPRDPEVNAVELDQEILLDWGSNQDRVAETEGQNEKGFVFQGYNVYQLPSSSASLDEAIRIATYDKMDGVSKIIDDYFDPSTGVVASGVIQFGTDSGIKRFKSIKNDEFDSGKPLVNGKTYYFAVTAYNYNADPNAVPNNLENPLRIFSVVPQSTSPGVSYPEDAATDFDEYSHTGSADGGPTITIVDPTALTGDTYEVYFNEQHYYRDKNGVWQKTNFPDAIGKPEDISLSYLFGSAIYGTSEGQLDLELGVVLGGPEDHGTYSYADGIKINFPSGTEIVSAYAYNADHSAQLEPTYIQGSEIMFGNNDTTTNGFIHGDTAPIIYITTQGASTPLNIDYVIYDDGWGPIYGPDYGVSEDFVNAEGTLTIDEAGYMFKTENHWNLKNVTQGTDVLEDMTLVGGTDLYTGEIVGADAAPIVDGFQISVDVNYAAPVDFAYWQQIKGSGPWAGGDVTSYGQHGWAATSKSVDAFGNGATELSELQKDYELRFTGEYAPGTYGGVDNVMAIAEGTGSVATLYGARVFENYITEHPLNPNNQPAFTMRIPFEVWNVDDNQQVNMIVYDRENASPVDNPPTPEAPWYPWNIAGRMYCDILNTPYSEDLNSPYEYDADGNPAAYTEASSHLTWNLVFWGTDWKTGDVLFFSYDNPVVLGTDKYTFTMDAPTYTDAQAREDLEEINVFPNPYYGTNSEELNKYYKFVTFSHLPPTATLRIFNLAGIQVRVLEKDDASQFVEWDLKNQDNLPVASGLYIVYIDMPDLGETKILKVAIIQEQQILDRF